MVRVEIELARNASERTGADVYRRMGRGRSSLAAIASSAFFVGIIGTVFAIVNSFTGVDGEKSAIMAAITWSLSQAIIPTAAGLLIAIFASVGNRYIGAQLEAFDFEMRAATLELANSLSLLRQGIRE